MYCSLRKVVTEQKQLLKENQELREENARLRQEVELLRQKMELLIRRIFGRFERKAGSQPARSLFASVGERREKSRRLLPGGG